MTYGYARVSSREQNTARQIDAFKSEHVDYIVEEHGSGKDFENRPEYQRLRRKLKSGDTLVVMSLDRFGRNYVEIIDEWRYLTKKKGVNIRVLDMPILSQTAPGLTGQFIADIVLQLLSYVAQSERERIHERQMQGIAAAKARGVRFGRPIKTVLPPDFAKVAELEIRGKLSVREASRQLGLNRSTYHHYSRMMFADLIREVNEEVVEE